jgi:hypothetical protein
MILSIVRKVKAKNMEKRWNRKNKYHMNAKRRKVIPDLDQPRACRSSLSRFSAVSQ